MISFLNDYNELAHPKVMDDLLKFAQEKNLGYGLDEHSIRAKEILKTTMKNSNLDIHFIHGGTMVNILGIMSMLDRYQGVISTDKGHIVATENGSIEALGHQIVQVDHRAGKLTIEEVDRARKKHSYEWSVDLKLLYISNATELGTVYTKQELKELSDYCRLNDMYIFVDGARMGTALSSEKSDLNLEDLVKYTDAFTIGGTKNGMLLGEALVIVNPKFKKGFRKITKQRGALLAKGYLMGIQFETMFEDGLYFELAEHANKMSSLMAFLLKESDVELLLPQESNLIFARLSKKQFNKIRKDFLVEVTKEDEAYVDIRIATTWNTKEEEIRRFIKKIKE